MRQSEETRINAQERNIVKDRVIVQRVLAGGGSAHPNTKELHSLVTRDGWSDDTSKQGTHTSDTRLVGMTHEQNVRIEQLHEHQTSTGKRERT